MTATGSKLLAGADWLTARPLVRVFDLLDADGEEARVVGGAVRNALMKLPVGDIDVATTALPDEVIRRARKAGIRAVPTGIDHGTVTLIVDSQPFEVTTLREDVETFGRKAKVAFGRDWTRDAQRRDFTINALSVTRDGTVHDAVGGLADVEARRVCFIGDAGTRIAEDYLRILRYFRFYAAYGEGEPDQAALSACIAGRDGLASLSRERIRAEFAKLLIARNVCAAITQMAQAGLLLRIIGGVVLPRSLEQMLRIEAALGLTPDATRRLGALTLFIPDDAARLFERLRLSNAEFQRLEAMADGWWRIDAGDLSPQAARALLYRSGPEAFTDRVLLAWTRSSADNDSMSWRELAELPSRWPMPSLPISAADLMTRGVAKGPALGAALRAAEEAWISADFPQDSSSISAIADAAARSQTA